MPVSMRCSKQRAPELEIFGGEIAIGEGDADQGFPWRWLARTRRESQRLVEPEQCARADPQDQLVDISHEIIDRAIGAADLAGQIAGFQARQPPLGDHPLGRLDQGDTQFLSPLQSFSHL
ncbi:hypothetical protein AB7M16_005250 [Bradyrhizobium sp. USDA 372]